VTTPARGRVIEKNAQHSIFIEFKNKKPACIGQVHIEIENYLSYTYFI